MNAKNEWLAGLIEERREKIIQRWMKYIRDAEIERYHRLPKKQLRQAMTTAIDCAASVLRTGAFEKLDEMAGRTVDERMQQGFTLPEIQQIFLGLERSVVEEVYETEPELEKRVSALQSASYLQDRVALKLAEFYQSLQYEQRARLTAVYDLGMALSRTLDLETVLNAAVQKVAETMHAGSAAILVAGEEGRPAEVAASYHMSPELASIVPTACRALGCWPVDTEPLPLKAGACTITDVRAEKSLEPLSARLVAQGCLAIMCVPLTAAQRVLGALMICMPEARDFPGFELDFLAALAHCTASAVQNARLFEEAKGKRELGLLLEAGKLFTSTLDLDEVLNQVARLVVENVGADLFAVLLPDEGRARMHIAASYARPGISADLVRFLISAVEPEGLELGRGVTGRAFMTGEALLVSDYAELPERIEQLGATIGSALVIPMKLRDRVIGVFFLASLRTHAFTEAHLHLATGLADQAAVAIENARLYEDTRRAAEEAQTLYSVAAVLVSEMNLDQILTTLLQRITETIGVSRCSLFLSDPATGVFKLSSSVGLTEEYYRLLVTCDRPGDYLSEEGKASLLAGRTLITPNGRSETEAARLLYPQLRMKRALLVPLVFKGKLVGLIALDEPGQEHEFTERDMTLASSIATLGVSAIENARVVERERNIAETFQRSLLPPVLPQIQGYELSARYRAALIEAEVGGDFYDAFQVAPTLTVLFIADVSGKGLSAAIHTAMGKYLVRAYAAEDSSPGRVLGRLNDALCKYIRYGLFVTVFYVLLDTERGIISYANAGHNQPLFYSKASDNITTLDITGPGAGAIPGAGYGERELVFGAGDVLFLYTDGATDARRGEEFLGLSGLEDIFTRHMGLPAEAAVERIYADLSEFTGGRFTDDVALLLLKRQT